MCNKGYRYDYEIIFHISLSTLLYLLLFVFPIDREGFTWNSLERRRRKLLLLDQKITQNFIEMHPSIVHLPDNVWITKTDHTRNTSKHFETRKVCFFVIKVIQLNQLKTLRQTKWTYLAVFVVPEIRTKLNKQIVFLLSIFSKRCACNDFDRIRMCLIQLKHTKKHKIARQRWKLYLNGWKTL